VLARFFGDAGQDPVKATQHFALGAALEPRFDQLGRASVILGIERSDGGLLEPHHGLCQQPTKLIVVCQDRGLCRSGKLEPATCEAVGDALILARERRIHGIADQCMTKRVLVRSRHR
jgi:hypothetical protein